MQFTIAESYIVLRKLVYGPKELQDLDLHKASKHVILITRL